MPLFALTIYCYLSLKGRIHHGHTSTELTFFDNLSLKEKIISKDYNGECNQWHELPTKVKSNLKSILVYVKHSPAQLLMSRIYEGSVSQNSYMFMLVDTTLKCL